MKTQHPLISRVVIATMLLAMAGCTSMTRHEKNTAIGAGAGAIGGAAIGGVIGHEVGK